MKSHLSILGLLFLFLSCQLQAQTMMTTTPNASPKSFVGQEIGLTMVKVVYHRPAVKDREVWGKLVPYNVAWRAGANENTVIHFSDKVKIEGAELAAGTYGLHMIPSEEEWTIVFSNNSTSWGSYSYNPGEDALRVNVKPQKANSYHEFLNYSFDNSDATSAALNMQWENMKVAFKIESNVHEAVLANFRNELRNKAGWTWVGWNEAANYCLKNNINHQEAIGWASRSVFMNPNQNNMLVKARLIAQSKGGSDEESQKVIFKTLAGDLDAMNVTWKEYLGAAKYAVNKEAWGKAEKWIDESIAMSANMTNMMEKSKIYATKGDQEMSDKVKSEALSKGTNQELNLYAYNLMWTGQSGKAVEVFEANAEKHPEDPNVWDSLGEGYFNNGQNDKAIEAFKKSLSMNPPAGVKANSLKFLSQLGVEMEEKIKP